MDTLTHDHRDLEVIPGLRREWMALARHRWLILGLTAISLTGAALYNYAVRPLYSGLAIVSAGETIPGQPNARANVTRTESLIREQIASLTSVEFATRVVQAATPLQKKELSTGPLGAWYSRLRFRTSEEAPSAPALELAQGVSALQSRLQLDWREPSTWIAVRVVAYDPEAAAELANAVVRLYIEETAETNRRSTQASANEFEEQVENRGKNLGEQLSGLREFGTETGLGDLGARRAMLDRQVRAFQEALVGAQTALVGRAATAREAVRTASSSAATDPLVQAARTRLMELEDREKALLATLGALHPDVVTVREEAQTARARLNAAIAAVAESAESSYQLALREAQRIEASLVNAQKELASLDSESLDYTLRQKKADASRAAVEQLIQRQQITAPVVLTTDIIQTAAPSTAPISPQKGQNLAYALIGGLLAGVLLTWGLERLDDTIQTPDDIKDFLGLPFLGVIPMVAKFPQGAISAALADTRTGFADGIRLVRTNLMYTAPQRKARVLVFTSASPGDGKSTVASGVAILLQETEARVLLIDGDLRRPTLDRRLDVAAVPGLSDLLAKRSPVSLVVTSTRNDGLDVLSSGPSLTTSAARLGSATMRSLIAQARERYDWVIIDSPPTLGLPDASVLATLADGVVVVCSGGKTPRQALRSVTDQLRGIDATILGVVLNCVDMNRHSYYYGRYYSPYYGEGGGAKGKHRGRHKLPA